VKGAAVKTETKNIVVLLILLFLALLTTGLASAGL